MTTPIRNLLANRILASLMLLLGAYQAWLVTDRWMEFFHWRTEFGRSDAGPWITLGLDTVLFGFASLVFVCFISLWCKRKTKHSKDSLGRIISTVAFLIAVLTVAALFVLILLPTTTFRR
jgi:hypothetical protein